MKKIVLAAVLATASLAATAQVTLSGKVSQWVENSKVGGVSDNAMVTEPTSNFAVGAKEQLGKGLVARAVVETSLRGNTIDGNGTILGDRQSTVGLGNKLGSVDLGRNVHTHFVNIASNDAFSALYGTIAGDIHNLRSLRHSDAVFVTLNPMKNASVSYDRASQGAESFGATASLAGFNFAVSRFQHNAEVSDVVSVNRTIAKNTAVFFSNSDNRGMLNTKGNLLGVKHTMGHVAVKASYGRQTNDLNPFVTGPSPKPDTAVTAYAIGADYNLSKRTELGVAFKNVNRYGSDSDVRQLGLGITHRF